MVGMVGTVGMGRAGVCLGTHEGFLLEGFHAYAAILRPRTREGLCLCWSALDLFASLASLVEFVGGPSSGMTECFSTKVQLTPVGDSASPSTPHLGDPR
jgi:hypothetical protein